VAVKKFGVGDINQVFKKVKPETIDTYDLYNNENTKKILHPRFFFRSTKFLNASIQVIRAKCISGDKQ